MIGVLLLVLIVASTLSWWGQRVSLFGAMPFMLLGVVLGGTDSGTALVNGLVGAVGGASEFLNALVN